MLRYKKRVILRTGKRKVTELQLQKMANPCQQGKHFMSLTSGQKLMMNFIPKTFGSCKNDVMTFKTIFY